MGLQVIGAGLPRTGTLSLKFALEKLGFDRCYHMTELLLNPHHAALWSAAADGRAEWETLFEGYRSSTDFPGCVFWRELSAHYPDAKVILTIRSPESWFDSVSETVGRAEHQAELAETPIGPMMGKVASRLGFGPDRDQMIARFSAHVDAVRAGIPAERLLVFEAGQGWEPLCAFLGVPVPDSPYPRINSRAETSAVIDGHSRATSFAERQAGIRRMLDDAAARI